MLKALPVLIFKYTGLEVGSYRLCRHNFENNMCAWELDNIPGGDTI